MMYRLRRYDVFRFAQNDVAPDGRNDAMFAPMCPQAHIISVSVIIGFSLHHLPKANIIQKTHLCLGRQKCVFCWRRRRDSRHTQSHSRRASFAGSFLRLLALCFPRVDYPPQGEFNSHQRKKQDHTARVWSCFLAEKERFELSRRLNVRPTPLAGAPLRPTWVLLRKYSFWLLKYYNK